MSATDDTSIAAASSRQEGGAQEPGGLFVRKSSGLVRELGIRDTFSVTVGGINPALVVAIFFVAISFASTADLTWPYVVAAAMMVPLALTYAQLVASMPRTGGDFVWLSRIFHPALGAAVGVGFLILVLLLVGSNAQAVANFGLPELVRVVGVTVGSDAVVDFAGDLTGRTSLLIVTTVIIALCCAVGMRGAHMLGRAMWWCFVAAVVGVVVMIVEALTHSTADLRAAYDAAHGAGAYANVMAAAADGGVDTGSTFDGFVTILPFAALGYWGFTVGNFPAGEMKRPARNYVRGTLIGLGVGAAFFVISWLAVRQLAGLRFLQSASVLSGSDPAAFERATDGGAPIVTQYYADLVASNDVSRIVIALGFTLGSIINPLVWVLVASRLAFALSFDRLLPQWLADVDERIHAPIKALVVTAIGALLFAVLTIYSTGFAGALRNLVLVFGVVFTLGSLAGVGLVLRRRDLYDSSPHVIGGSWLGMPPIFFIALASAVLQGGLLVVAATNSSLSGGYDTGSIVTLLVVGLAGVVAYVVSRLHSRARGIDLRLAMRELPPE